MREKVAEIIREARLNAIYNPLQLEREVLANEVYADQILTLFPDLSAWEVEVDCIKCDGIGSIGRTQSFDGSGVVEIGCLYCNAGTIRIPLSQFIAEGRSEGKLIRKEKV